MGTPQDPRARHREKARRTRKQQKLAAVKTTETASAKPAAKTASSSK